MKRGNDFLYLSMGEIESIRRFRQRPNSRFIVICGLGGLGIPPPA
jgi:hypothetical protein